MSRTRKHLMKIFNSAQTDNGLFNAVLACGSAYRRNFVARSYFLHFSLRAYVTCEDEEWKEAIIGELYSMVRRIDGLDDLSIGEEIDEWMVAF